MRTCICMLLTLFLLAGLALAVDVGESQREALKTDELQEAAEDYLPDVSITDPDPDAALATIFETGGAAVGGVFKRALRSAALLLLIALLCQTVSALREAGIEGGGADVIHVVGALGVATVAAGDVQSLMGLGREAIDTLGTFSNLLLPTLTAAASAAGAPTASTARQLATMLFSDVLLTAIDRLLVPMVYAYTALLTACAAVGNAGLKRMAGLVKWAVTTLLTLLLLAFVAYLTLSGIVTGSADAMTVKAARFAVSGAVPVVGSILSDAAETVLVGAGVLRNAIGVFGMLAVLGICVTPFLEIGFHYLAYKIAGAFAATISDDRLGGLIDGIGSAFGLILGMLAAAALLLFVSVIAAVAVVGGG